ncbi:glycoside hydrolase family 76 [Colletotrichum nymphaeae SA-01]|uniref:Mannan endo-1,6-alpha-mannosidase n=1 Tax=Colletotrichum nymphaeae SA-01 TaxID=1460502 RepID=A0A135SXJ2_9PEZI|nr:glycoside hydrolase family 76 [Colletotrichum nymphaeae SA-01]
MTPSYASAFAGALLLLGRLPCSAAEFKTSSRDEIVASSNKLAKDLFTVYGGDQPGEIPGILPGPPTPSSGGYYWYHGASFFQTYVDYQHLTGDDSFQDSIVKALAFQLGPDANYMLPNWTASMGNDDQCFWGTAALQAAEYQLPSADGKPSWIEVAKNVWANQASPDRYDKTCGGGLRWQIIMSNAGYNYKNTMSNACFLNMGARLARYTGNTTYAEHAVKAWDWLESVGFINTTTWEVYDGANVDDNCTSPAKYQWSQNAAILTEGAAFMYNFTNSSDVWRYRAEKLAEASIKTFFPKGIAYEAACEGTKGSCPTDAMFMKGYVHRWLSVATQVAPFLSEKVLTVLRSSAQAAAKQCQDNSKGTTTCGFYWSDAEFTDPQTVDNRTGGITGVGEGMSVLGAISGLLIGDAKAPVTNWIEGSGGASMPEPTTSTRSRDTPSATGGSPSPTESDSLAGHFGTDVRASLLPAVLGVCLLALY